MVKEDYVKKVIMGAAFNEFAAAETLRNAAQRLSYPSSGELIVVSESLERSSNRLREALCVLSRSSI